MHVREATLEQLEHDLVRLADDLGRGMARWLALVAEFDRREGAREWGFRSTAEWLAWRCAIGPRAARDHVRVARRLAAMPLVRQAFTAGELSYSKVRALSRAGAGEAEHQLLELARRSTAAGLERAVMALRSAPSADIDVANRAHECRTLQWWWDPVDGSLRFCGRLAADEGAAFVEAIETAAEALHCPADAVHAPSRPPLGARRADALTEIALSGAPRTQVVLHVDDAALACTATSADQRTGELCALEHGPAVPSETARRHACDAELISAHPSADAITDHGRARRVVSPALRAQLERRDRGCRYPGCTRRHGIHAHHIHHWAHGGRTDLANLMLLCRFHHRLVHEGGFTIERLRGAATFVRPDGRPVPDIPARDEWQPPPTQLAA